MTSASTADSLPCPEARFWSDREWASYYARRNRPYVPAPKPVVIPRAKAAPAPVEKPIEPAPVVVREVRESRKLYSSPIGPVRRTTESGDDESQLAQIQRRVLSVDDLNPENVVRNDIVPWQMLVAWICRKHGVEPIDLFSSRRTLRLVEPRQELCGLARRHTVKSLPEIGRLIGNRDHTTVLHSVRKFEGWVEAGRMIPWQAMRMGDR